MAQPLQLLKTQIIVSRSARLAAVRVQQPVQIGNPWSQVRPRLHAALVRERRFVNAQDRASTFLGGERQRVIRDNMKTAVDAIFVERERRDDRR